MVPDEQDEMIERIADGLRPLPEVDPEARARVLVAVAAERERDRERRSPVRRRRRAGMWAAAALAAAVAFSAVVLERSPGARQTATLVGATTRPAPLPAPSAATLARDDAGRTSLQQVQLVFRAPQAHRVSVVGDFSGWDPGQARMTRDSASGLWNVTLALPAGRHVYAFLVDDSVLVRDPRAPAAPDADFGRPGSIMLVGHP